MGKRPAVSSSPNYYQPKCALPVHKTSINIDKSIYRIPSGDVFS
nr:MAG TPA: hypothetical protein [Caudoviricetes sp.]